jgi:formylglycine-generating enzyme required for sulfatase activity
VRSPAELLAPPGDYLVEVAWPDGRFHEVYRHVPKVGEPGSGSARGRSLRWGFQGDAVKLIEIDIPPVSVLEGMVYFEGKSNDAGRRLFPGRSPHGSTLNAYYLDQHEVSAKELLKLLKRFPSNLANLGLKPEEAIRYVSWDEAAAYAEMMGKRLPTDAEYEFAATAGGTRLFPGRDPTPYKENRSWPFGPVGTPDYDRTDTDPPVFGLYSNVAEWTSSWWISTPRVYVSGEKDMSKLRVVRGGPASVVRGKPDPSEFDVGIRAQLPFHRSSVWLPGVGFRGARSFAPRFLDREGATSPR